MPANEKERTPHTMNVDRHAPTSEAMARIHISNLSESQPMVVPETVLATLRAVSVNEDCDALRPSDEANARKRHQIECPITMSYMYSYILGSHVVGIK